MSMESSQPRLSGARGLIFGPDQLRQPRERDRFVTPVAWMPCLPLDDPEPVLSPGALTPFLPHLGDGVERVQHGGRP